MQSILIVEDDNKIRENLAELLQLEGYLTFEAANGQEGVFLAQREKIDLIICDIMMPIMDGYQLLAILRRYPNTLTIPVIFLTAKTSRNDQRSGMDLGAEDYITKPFTRMEVLKSIQTRLARKSELDDALQNQNTSLLKEQNEQMPFEFTSSITMVETLSKSIINHVKADTDQYVIDASRMIFHAAQLLKDISAKYMYLAELEHRQPLIESQTNYSRASVDIADLLEEKAADYGFAKIQIFLKPFISKVEEEDLVRIIEMLAAEIFRNAKQDVNIQVSGLMKNDSDYQMKFTYQSWNSDENSDEKSEVQRFNLVKKQVSWKQLVHIGLHLNCRLEMHESKSGSEIILTIPAITSEV